MPIFQWVNASLTTASTTTAPTHSAFGNGTAAGTSCDQSRLFQPLQVQHYISQPATIIAGDFWQLGSIIWQGEIDVTPAQYFDLAKNRAVHVRERTAEETRQLAERQQAYIAERHEVALRSLELLLSNLTAAQRESFEARRWFVVEGGRSKQRYRIRDAGHARQHRRPRWQAHHASPLLSLRPFDSDLRQYAGAEAHA